MKAWIVTDGEIYELVRAETRAQAIYRSDLYRDLYLHEFDGWTAMRARRAREFDGDFPLTDEHYLRAGISVGCARCGYEVFPGELQDGEATAIDGKAYHRRCPTTLVTLPHSGAVRGGGLGACGCS